MGQTRGLYSPPPGSQEQLEPYLEALLSLSAAFLWRGPQHAHSGEQFPNKDRRKGSWEEAPCLSCISFIHTHAPSQVRCSDYDSDGSHDLIGTFHTTLAQLQAVPVSVDCW